MSHRQDSARRAWTARVRSGGSLFATLAGVALLVASGQDVALVRSAILGRTALAAVPAQSCEATVQLDAAVVTAPLQGTVQLTGYAFDPSAAEGTGVSSVQLWLGGPPEATETAPAGKLLGEATLGVARPELGAANPNFATAGFGYAWNTAATPGAQTLYVVAQTGCGPVVISQPVLVLAPAPAAPAAAAPPAAAPPAAAAACAPTILLDQPDLTLYATGTVTVTGYAADPKAKTGTGVASVGLFLDPTGAGDPIAAGTYGLTRPDATAALGDPRFGRSGFSIKLDATNVPTDVTALAVGAVPTAAGCAPAVASLTVTRRATPPPAAVTPISSTAGVTGTTGVAGTSGVTGTTGVTATAGVTGTTRVTATSGVSTTISVPNSSAVGPDNVSLSPISGTPTGAVTSGPPPAAAPPPSVAGAQQRLQTASAADRVVVVTFTGQPNATGYILYRGTAPNATFSEVNTAGASDSVVTDIQILTPGTYYYYMVATYPGGVKSQNSNVVSVQVR